MDGLKNIRYATCSCCGEKLSFITSGEPGDVERVMCLICSGRYPVEACYCKKCAIHCRCPKEARKIPMPQIEGITLEVENDPVINNPIHYGGKDNPYETIKVIEALSIGKGFVLGNAIKYLMRAGKKGDEAEDLKKAIWYINRRLEQIEKKIHE